MKDLLRPIIAMALSLALPAVSVHAQYIEKQEGSVKVNAPAADFSALVTPKVRSAQTMTTPIGAPSTCPTTTSSSSLGQRTKTRDAASSACVKAGTARPSMCPNR